ncbi:hypothetical protein SAMN05444128_3533 [Pontibacter indicus]|uniref:Uncharacterized protein n=1 Tax=Pontibacter indicus TaxID=1317125 RepID=A0A1R3XR76_9BACT|nr:hypothetical protein SAMN05444128_3533 [Pontibacter indicus]
MGKVLFLIAIYQVSVIAACAQSIRDFNSEPSIYINHKPHIITTKG